MASSSDWLAEAQKQPSTTPNWIASLSARDGFVAGMPFLDGQVIAQPAVAETQADAEPAIDAESIAFANGEAAGRAAAMSEAEQTLSAQRALRVAFRSLDQAAIDALAADLKETVIALCGQVIDETAIDIRALTERCLVAAQRIGTAADHCTLHLHPEDITTLSEGALDGRNIQADPAIERGDVLVEGPDGAVRDGPSEWRRAIAAALNQ